MSRRLVGPSLIDLPGFTEGSSDGILCCPGCFTPVCYNSKMYVFPIHVGAIGLQQYKWTLPIDRGRQRIC